MSDEPTDHLSTRPLDRAGRSILDLAGCELTVVSGPDRALSIKVEGRPVRVGKGPGCDLKLTDQSVSRFHVLISPSPDGFVIEDLGSTNGTEVNGARVASATVTGRCRIGLGQTVLECAPVVRKLVTGPASVSALEGMLGDSLAMRAAYGLIRQVAPTEASVVITGETGTGKELAARAIHAQSLRKAGPFEVVDCGNVDRELLGSQLFGHEKGAFTGAVSAYRGAFDRARKGTLFLDEIGELSADVQTRLLGVLQRREVRPLGADTAHPIDTRVVAATHRDLEAMVSRGQFREDLYFRLVVIVVHLPPLRERRADIPVLVAHFLDELAPGAPARIAPAAMEFLVAQPWKGNVRELRNAVQRALVLSGGAEIEIPHLTLSPRADAAVPGTAPGRPVTLEESERAAIQEALRRNAGNKSRTARELGIALATLKRKLREYGLAAASEDP